MTVALVAGSGITSDYLDSALQRRGEDVVRVSRSKADMDDVERMAGALDGVERAYLIAPGLHPREAELVSHVLEACRVAGVSRVVLHSVLHPYEPEMPHHLRKLAVELAVRRSGLRWTILQPASYAQNFIRSLRRQADGSWVLPAGWPEDSPGLAVVDLADVAEVAATVLCTDDDQDATYELAGPERLTLRRMAEIVAEVFGSACEIVQESPEQFNPPQSSEQRLADTRAYFANYSAHGLPGSSRQMEGLLRRPATPFGTVLSRELARSPG